MVLILEKKISRLVLTHKDRLLRFGAELIFALCEARQIEVIMINKGSEAFFEEELAQDVLEIITVFSAKNGIAVHQVNPAFTSLIGHVNYAMRYGLSIHLAAALCIARRHQKFSESPCSPTGKVPDGKGGHIAFVLPARNRMKHVWHFWRQVKRKLPTVLAAHFRAKHHRSSSPPIFDS